MVYRHLSALPWGAALYFDKDLPRIIGYTHDRVSYVSYFDVPGQEQNMGIGTQLIREFALRLQETGCVRIDLDDMSARFRHPRNIYLKCGFVYCDSTSTMMSASPDTVIRLTQVDAN